ncbi:hypothetical protein GpartN1_g2499.t1 [Galdieria partita]|uniref:THIF-type NAD/FAD binding fold domain-containing protein n=1 Tax=Galdieria partita TaxID=83374 RepID=A0A9C7PTV9_9RHOD|nr:hypothetical protein GpartN1_g2499.t1 [Galdieria partita]
MTSAIYDRQIRLWGLQTQSKISQSRIFLYGYHCGLLEELAKDLVLTGVGTLVIGEYSEVTETLGRQPMFVTYLGHDLEQLVEALSVLNPHAQIYTVNTFLKQHFSQLVEEQNELQRVSKLIETKTFAICCLVCERLGSPIALALDRVCRDNNTFFMYAEIAGALGFLILDLGCHYTYRQLKKISERASKTKIRSFKNDEVIDLDVNDSEEAKDDHSYSIPLEDEHTLDYPTLEQVFSCKCGLLQSSSKASLVFLAFVRKWKEEYSVTSQQDCLEERQRKFEMFLQRQKIGLRKCEMQSLYKFCSFIDVELISASSCLAGILGREIVKLISRNEKPIFNIFIFDAFSCLGSIVDIPSTLRVDRKRSRDDEVESPIYDI